MTTALCAQRILEAWEPFNPARFEAELDNALSACERSVPSSELETEQRAVLESVVQRFRKLSLEGLSSSPCRFDAGFLLLRHLQGRS